MNNNTLTFFRFFLISFLLLMSGFANSIEKLTPEMVLRDFYHALLTETKEYDSLMDKYVSKSLNRSVTNSSLCNYDSGNSVKVEKICAQKRECKKKYKGGYICNWDGVWIEVDVDYFTKSQDDYPSWSEYIEITPEEQSQDRMVYIVSLGVDPDLVKKLRVTLEVIDHEWKITTVTDY